MSISSDVSPMAVTPYETGFLGVLSASFSQLLKARSLSEVPSPLVSVLSGKLPAGTKMQKEVHFLDQQGNYYRMNFELTEFDLNEFSIVTSSPVSPS